MRLLKPAPRSQADIADDFARLVEEGRALLGEMVGKKTTRDTLDQVSAKVAEPSMASRRIASFARTRGRRSPVESR
jgi:hypothetical protein